MAVANSCLEKDWEEGKRELEENRRRRWRERVSCWAKVEVSDKEEGGEQEDDNSEEEEENEIREKVKEWSVSLGPEVDHVGLEAIVQFAYTGLIPCLNENSVDQIKSAAQTLGASRVLELCTEEKSTKTGGQKKDERILAEEQMMISLQSIKGLWMDRLGCDVILEAIGGSLHGDSLL
uniref:BTB domain-containing protein n=1 Tax=Monopterus albus TaxID=43700 RepID=A0A3Q3J1Y6_MONAL